MGVVVWLPGKRWHCNMILEALVFLIFLLWTRLNKRDGFERIRLRRFVLGSTWISQYRSMFGQCSTFVVT